MEVGHDDTTAGTDGAGRVSPATGPSGGRIHLGGAQQTMLGTLWCRAVDARRRRPILGDHAAVHAVDRIDHPFHRLGVDAMTVAVTCTRARWMDERVARFLAGHARATVLHLACGLDTRQQRLRPGPGVQWFEVDQPDVIAVRRQVLPPPPGVELVDADVTDSGWFAAVPQDRPTLVVAEGLSMYLDPERGRALLTRLASTLRGELIMDFNGRAGMVGQVLNRTVRRSRARWTWLVDEPGSLQEHGPVLQESVPLIDLLRALDPRQLPLPRWLALQGSRLTPAPPAGLLARYGLPGS
ncbi:MAG TPA: class I SAM-dependent methyltransferase [Bacillota bacterium]|nr:class I SAM-dependent methyltransferase [Bacillota bacterium]